MHVGHAPSSSAERAPAARVAASTFLSTNALMRLAWWYVALLGATVAFKIACLRKVYDVGGLSFVLREMAAASGTPRCVVAAAIVARDVVQVAVLAVVTHALVRAAPLSLRGLAYGLVVSSVVVVLGLNQLSFHQLSTFATYETLVTAVVFVTTHGEMSAQYLTPTTAWFVLGASVWAAFPPLAYRFCSKHRRLARLQAALVPATCGLVLAGAALSAFGHLRFPTDPYPLHGSWTHMATAALSGGASSPGAHEVPSARALIATYQHLTTPGARETRADLLAPAIEARIRPRHVLVVGLETAPRTFYPLTSGSPTLPNFKRMTERAIVSERHYTTSPFTRVANFTLLTGLHAPSSGLPSRLGHIAADALASTLRKQGYRTHYVDSWVLDWLPGSGERRQAQDLGFDDITDRRHQRDDGSFEKLLEAESASFDRAYETIARAHAEGHKAAVFVGTMLGHFPWVAPRGREHTSSQAKLQGLATTLDALFGRLLERLDAAGLTDEVLILVVGDHGLRYADEFESVGQHLAHTDVAFNVPFLLYAPGLTDHTVRVPWATSHVDVTPTLLHLVGVDTQGMLHHGGYVLDRRLEQRAVLMLNTRLGPVDGILWRGHYITHNALTGMTRVGDGTDVSTFRPLSTAERELPPPLRAPGALLRELKQHFDLVGAALHERAREHAVTSRAAQVR